jgi:hypothetical protein
MHQTTWKLIWHISAYSIKTCDQYKLPVSLCKHIWIAYISFKTSITRDFYFLVTPLTFFHSCLNQVKEKVEIYKQAENEC